MNAQQYSEALVRKDKRIAELEKDLKHLHSRWDWTEYWFDNLYPTDWERCQTRYDATKAGAQPVARRQQGEGGEG